MQRLPEPKAERLNISFGLLFILMALILVYLARN